MQEQLKQEKYYQRCSYWTIMSIPARRTLASFVGRDSHAVTLLVNDGPAAALKG